MRDVLPVDDFPLRPARLLATRFQQYGSWYLIFSEFPELTDESMTRFMSVADSIGDISNQTLRQNAVGRSRRTSEFGRSLRVRVRFLRRR